MQPRRKQHGTTLHAQPCCAVSGDNKRTVRFAY